MKGLKDKSNGRFVVNLKDKRCLVCQKVFHPRFATRKYCSHKCKGLSYKKDRNRLCVICNKSFFAQSFKTRFCSQACYSASGIRAKKGSLNIFWKGGVTPINILIRSSAKYLNWVKYCLHRDDYTCAWCKERGGKLHVDHIITFSSIIDKLKLEQGVQDLYKKAMDYKLLWETSNGRTLCIDCHKKTDTYLNHKSKKHVYNI